MANVIALPVINNNFSKSQKLSETFQHLLKASVATKETGTSTNKERPGAEKVSKCKICGCDPCSCRHGANEGHSRETRYGALVSCSKCGFIPCRCPCASSPKLVRNFTTAVVGSDLKSISACRKCGCAPCKCLSAALLRELGAFGINEMSYISTDCGIRCCKCGCIPCRCAAASSDLPAVLKLGNVCSKCGCTPCRCISMAVCELGMEKVLGMRYLSTSAAKCCSKCGCTPCRCGLALSVAPKSGICCKCGCTPCKCRSVVLLRESTIGPNIVRYMSSDSIRGCCKCGCSPCRCASTLCDGSAKGKGDVCSYCGGYGPCNCGAHSGPCCKCGCEPCKCGNVCPKCGKNPCVCEKDKIWSSKADIGSPALDIADSRNNY